MFRSTLLLCLAGAAVAFTPASLPFQTALRSPRATGVCSLRAATTSRPIFRSEVIAIKRQSAGLKDEELKSWLQTRGYTDATVDEIVKQLNAQGEAEEWENQAAKAAELKTKAKANKQKLDDLQEKAAALQAQAAGELTSAVTKAKEAVDNAAQEVEAWGWVPLKGDQSRAALQDAEKAYEEAVAAKDAAEAEAKEATAGAEVLKAACTADMAAAEEMQVASTKTLWQMEVARTSPLLAQATKAIADAERAVASGNPSRASSIVSSAEPVFEALGLQADKRVGLNSLPGRLASVLEAASAPASSSSSAPRSSSSSASPADSETMSRGALIGAAALAVLGGGAYLLQQQPKPAPSSAPAQ